MVKAAECRSRRAQLLRRRRRVPGDSWLSNQKLASWISKSNTTMESVGKRRTRSGPLADNVSSKPGGARFKCKPDRTPSSHLILIGAAAERSLQSPEPRQRSHWPLEARLFMSVRCYRPLYLPLRVSVLALMPSIHSRFSKIACWNRGLNDPSSNQSNAVNACFGT